MDDVEDHVKRAAVQALGFPQQACRAGRCRRNACCLGVQYGAFALPCLSNVTPAQQAAYEMLISELSLAWRSPLDWLMSTLFMTDEKLPMFAPVVNALCIGQNAKSQRGFRRLAHRHLQSRLARNAPPALSSNQ